MSGATTSTENIGGASAPGDLAAAGSSKFGVRIVAVESPEPVDTEALDPLLGILSCIGVVDGKAGSG